VSGCAILGKAETPEFIEKMHQKNELLKQVLCHKTLKTPQEICRKTIASCNCPKINTNKLIEK
jgi:hypothetical protein